MNINLITTLFVYAVLLHRGLEKVADTLHYVPQSKKWRDMSPCLPRELHP